MATIRKCEYLTIVEFEFTTCIDLHELGYSNESFDEIILLGIEAYGGPLITPWSQVTTTVMIKRYLRMQY